MGCALSREETTQRKSSADIFEFFESESEMTVGPAIMNAIRMKDIKLFEKTIKMDDIICSLKKNTTIRQKTILHDIAETNFHEGMSLIVGQIVSFYRKDVSKASKIFNRRDLDGNTPFMVCCAYDSFETLKILAGLDKLIDQDIRNIAGQTALDIALKHGCKCADFFSSGFLFARTIAISTYNSVGEVFDQDMSKSLISPWSPLLSERGTTIQLSSIIEEIKESTRNFIDDEFPHDVYSLTNQDFDQDMELDISPIKWLRITDILTNPKNICLFDEVIPNYVPNSLLKECDLYFALAAITKFPKHLSNIFKTSQVTDLQGAHSVNFLVSGIPITISLDDYFPCLDQSKLIFSVPHNNEIWFLLLEKAFAKLYGNYGLLPTVTLCDALNTMTGMPTFTHKLKDTQVEKLWKILVKSSCKDYIMCAERKQKCSDYFDRIVSIIEIFEVDEIKVLKLKSYYTQVSETGWLSKLTQDPQKWTKELREYVGYRKGNKDSIYMDLEEFCELFDSVCICYCDQDWTRKELQAQADVGESKYFELDIEKKASVAISVHQKLPLFVNDPEYSLSPISITVAYKKSNGILQGKAFGEKEALLGKHVSFAHDKVYKRLSEGTYVIRVKSIWTNKPTNGYALNVYCSSFSNFQIREVNKTDYPQFLNKLSIPQCLLTKPLYRYNNECQIATAWSGCHLLIFAVNDGDKTWNLNFTFNDIRNLKLCKQYRKEENTLGLTIPSKTKATAYAKRINKGAVKFSWKFEQSWE